MRVRWEPRGSVTICADCGGLVYLGDDLVERRVAVDVAHDERPREAAGNLCGRRRHEVGHALSQSDKKSRSRLTRFLGLGVKVDESMTIGSGLCELNEVHYIPSERLKAYFLLVFEEPAISVATRIDGVHF